jgi:hypothetical protein
MPLADDVPGTFGVKSCRLCYAPGASDRGHVFSFLEPWRVTQFVERARGRCQSMRQNFAHAMHRPLKKVKSQAYESPAD